MDTSRNLSERTPLEEILKSNAALENIMYIKDLLSSLSSIICIINSKNQIVFSNDVILEKHGLNLERDVLGFRPGELFQCVNAKNKTGGCGTSVKCQYCGAYKAIENSWATKSKITNECRITKQDNGNTIQLDLEITATPFFHDDEYVIISMQDITEKKREKLLERIFFHDIINIAGSLNGVLQLINYLSAEEKEKYLEIASSLSNQIVDEIKGQQQMLKAERGDLIANPTKINLYSFINKIADQIRFNQTAIEKTVQVEDFTKNASIVTDETLLTRVLVNMTKNALEATNPGGTIQILAKKTNEKYRIEVHNTAYIHPDVQNQLFQRSYSTKGKDRGVGTYSMKLIGERYLNGRVNFESSENTGTTFYIELPDELDA